MTLPELTEIIKTRGIVITDGGEHWKELAPEIERVWPELRWASGDVPSKIIVTAKACHIGDFWLTKSDAEIRAFRMSKPPYIVAFNAHDRIGNSATIATSELLTITKGTP